MIFNKKKEEEVAHSLQQIFQSGSTEEEAIETSATPILDPVTPTPPRQQPIINNRTVTQPKKERPAQSGERPSYWENKPHINEGRRHEPSPSRTPSREPDPEPRSEQQAQPQTQQQTQTTDKTIPISSKRKKKEETEEQVKVPSKDKDESIDLGPIGWTSSAYLIFSVTFELNGPALGMAIFSPHIWMPLIIALTLLVTIVKDLRSYGWYLLYIGVAYSILFVVRLLPLINAK